MSVTSILGINEVGENQVDKYITINDGFAALERAMQARYVNDIASADDVNLNDAQATRFAFYEIQAKTGNYNLVFPAGPYGNPAQRLFWVFNNTAYACTVKADTGSGSVVVVQPGAKILVLQLFEDITSVVSFSGAPTYDIGFFMPGRPEDSALLMKAVITRAMTIPDDFDGSRGHCGVNPAAAASFNVRKNGVSIGSINIDTSGVFSFSTTASGPEVFAPGDVLDVVAPTPQDAALEDISLMLSGTRLG